MLTDAILIARLAYEIGERFSGARVQDAGLLADGRFALALWKGGTTQLLAADVFAATPVLSIEPGELPVAAEPGFVRAAVTSLRAKTLHASRARDGERIVELEFAARSRFGVTESYVLIYELVPRYGNIVLAKDRTVVAALKEFRASGKAQRSIRAGHLYEPPPPRPRRGTESTAPSAEAIQNGDLYVYRDESGAILAAHVIPLEKFAGAHSERSRSLLDVFAETRKAGTSRGSSPDVRAGALRALNEKEKRLRAELQRVTAQIATVAGRDDLRAQGEAIYARLHEVAAPHRAAEKARAAELFARYKKAAASAVHLVRRKQITETALADLEDLRWELERAGEERVREVAALVTRNARKTPATISRKRKSPPPQIVTQHGSRILFGRSPLENAELTFRIARPADLWFHARGQPGAHVILQRDDRSDAPEDDVRMAAQLAAFHSKGRESSKVTVDYTQRKHVRKRPNAAPGLVFYTDASSLTVEPRDSMNMASPNEKKR